MTTRSAVLLSSALALFSACGSDADEPTPYGGEVLISHLRLGDGGDLLRLSAYFIASQDPDLAPADVPLGECGPDLSFEQGEAREYIDVGDSVTFHLGSGDIVVPRLVADPDSTDCESAVPCADGVMDFADRIHAIAYLSEPFDADLGDGFLLGQDSVTTADPQSFSDELSVLQPPRMEVDAPATSSLARGQDFELTWHQTAPVDDLTVKIVLAADGASSQISCRAADTGSFTVPASVVDGLESDTGVLIVYSVSRATVMTATGRAIDVRAEYHGNLFPFQRQ